MCKWFRFINPSEQDGIDSVCEIPEKYEQIAIDNWYSGGDLHDGIYRGGIDAVYSKSNGVTIFDDVNEGAFFEFVIDVMEGVYDFIIFER